MGKIVTVAFVLLFAAPFGGVGVWATWSIGSTLHDAWQAREWVRVPATVEAASLRESTDSEGSDTYQAEGRYAYVFEGKRYTSTRLGLSTRGGSDNIDSWHHGVHDRLAQARAAGRPVDAWVNPANPAESVLVRDVRWGEILFLVPFSLAFGGVGIGALVFAFHLLKVQKALLGEGPPQARQAPGPAAAKAVGQLDREGSARFLWIFAFFWNAIAWPIAILAVKDVVRTGEWAGLLVLLFPLVGLLVLWGAIAATWQAYARRRRGTAPAPAAADSMAAQAKRAMFEPAASGPGQTLGARPPARGLPIPASVATVTEAGGVLIIRYNTRRRLGLAVAMLLVGLFLAGIGVVLLVAGESTVGGIAMLALGAILDVAAAALLVGGLEVRAQAGELTVERVGLTGRSSSRIRRDFIRAIRPVQSYSVNEEPYFTIQADLGGERVALGSSIKGEELAVGIARRIAAAIGLDEARVARPETYD